MVTVVDVVESDRSLGQEVKIFRMGLSQFLGSSEGINKQGCSSLDLVTEAVKKLEARGMLEVPVKMA